MARSQVLYEMLWYAQNKKQFTAQELADEFQLSVRSVYRYLSDLAEMGLYIESRQGRYGGFTVLDNPLLPPVLFLEEEIISIFFSMSSLDDYQDFPFKVNGATAREKMLSVVSPALKNRLEKLSEVFQLRQPHQVVETPFLTKVMGAALAKERIKVIYHSQSRQPLKHLEPIGVYASNGLWYLFARDVALDQTRHYRIDRIKSVIKTTESFTRLETLAGSDDYQVIEPLKLMVKLTETGVKRCFENRYLGKSVELNADGSGQLNGEISRSDIPYTGEFIMQLGGEAQVVEPQEMIHWLVTRAKEVLTQYDKESDEC